MRGYLARVRVERLYRAHLELKPLDRAYTYLIEEVRAACDELRRQRREAATVLVQSYARRALAVATARRMLTEREELERLSRQYDLLVAEVRQS